MILNKYSRIRTLHVCGYQVFIIFPNVRDNMAAALALTKDQLTLKLSVLFPAWSRERETDCTSVHRCVLCTVLITTNVIPLNIYITLGDGSITYKPVMHICSPRE